MVSKLGKKLAQTEAFIARYSKNVSGVSVTRAGALSVCVATASAFLRGLRKNIHGVPWSDGFRLNEHYFGGAAYLAHSVCNWSLLSPAVGDTAI